MVLRDLDKDITYDYIMAGGGAAGLSLAYQVYQQSRRRPRILIIDRDRKQHNDRTWCFWTPQATLFDSIVHHVWDRAEVISEDFHRIYDLAPYQYKMIRGIDFYQEVRETLEPLPGITFLHQGVDEIQDSKYGAQVLVGGKAYVGTWVFDSLARLTGGTNSGEEDFNRYNDLKQHFKGWEIETQTDVFNPDVVRLFDFRTPQKGAMRFFYILPFSRRRAMIEYTLFSHDLLKPHQYDHAIGEYIEKVLKVTDYRVTATESGVIPMTDRPFPRRLGHRVMAVGTKGGMVKPSTGYAFLRILKDSMAIARSLEDYGHPFAVPATPWRYRLFDTLMLQVMASAEENFRAKGSPQDGERMKEIFIQLFRNNSIQQIFAFLDETAAPPDNLRLMASVPPAPFMKAFFKVILK